MVLARKEREKGDGIRMVRPNEQRLLAYRKGDKPWSWIFQQFSNRIPPPVRTRCNMLWLETKRLLVGGLVSSSSSVAYLSLSVCRDEYLKGTFSHCQLVASQEQVQSREATFKARVIRESDVWVEYHKESRGVDIGSRQSL
jgi:Tfp pilus assembly protein PilN